MFLGQGILNAFHAGKVIQVGHNRFLTVYQKLESSDPILRNFDQVLQNKISHMRDLLQKTISVMKKRVKKNLKAINENQKVIKELLKQPNTPERAIEFEKYYGANKTLLQENNDYINIQLTLINFLEKYKGTAVLDDGMQVVDIYSITDDNEVLDLTIKGVVTFDEKHPKYNNSEFIDKLINHFESKEEYEKCQKLYDMKSKLV